MATVQGPPPAKRQRDEAGGAIIVAPSAPSAITTRSSSLPTPTLELQGHSGSVYALEYSIDGAILCSASFDMKCLLWSHRNREDDLLEAETTATASYDNFGVLEGHKNAVLDMTWCDDEDCLATASADKTVMLWDATTGGTRLRKWAEHTGVVNAITRVNEYNVVSASDDATCRLWDRRQKRPVSVFKTDYPILAVAAAGGGDQIYTAGIDPKIYAWDIRRTEHPVFGMSGHSDTTTCLAMHPEGTHLLSNSMDQSLRTWDIRPFAKSKRHCKTFTGHKHNMEKGLLKCSWSADGSLVSAGSSDRRVHIWDEVSGLELYDLPGHTGCVNAVTFHPTEATVVASGGSDKRILVGELSA